MKEARRAIEALRAGVPNRDAVTQLRCEQPEVEGAFAERLGQLGTDESQVQVKGFVIEGGFGAGKSHALEYLQFLAEQQQLVVSKVALGKETPLFDPGKFFRSIIESAVVPGRVGPVLEITGNLLRPESPSYVAIRSWTNSGSEVDRLFGATLFLFEKMNADRENRHRIVRFWSGERLSTVDVRRWLRTLGEAATYPVGNVNARTLAYQRFRFASRLMRAAGLRGWVVLVDELELIARYSLQQRAKSYAEFARWMGSLTHDQYPGMLAIFALSDDFVAKILEERQDRQNVPQRLLLRNTEADRILAGEAQVGMRLLNEAITLRKPNEERLRGIYEQAKNLHREAHNWEPPDVPDAERSATTRQHIKTWITHWDLRRLYPEYEPHIQHRAIGFDYSENPDLEKPSEDGEETND